MKKMVKKLSILFTLVMVSTLFVGISAQAANTVFMCPDFTDPNPPSNIYYINGSNVEIYNADYGICADLVNTAGIGAGISEISAHVNEQSGNHFVIGVYTNGDDFSANDINAIVGDGWDRIEAYYYDYFVAVNPVQTSEAFAPRIQKSENDIARQLIANSGYESDVAMIDISGINQPFFGAIYYQPDFSFLGNDSLYCYKYMPSIGYFVDTNAEIYYNGYDSGFLDMNNLDSIDGSADGTFVIVNSSLPEGIVASADNWMNMEPIVSVEDSNKESDTESAYTDKSNEVSNEGVPEDNSNEVILTTDSVSAEELEKYVEKNETLFIQNKEKSVEWIIDKVEYGIDFDTTATIDSINETDYIIDFAHSGNLPGEAQVIISLPNISCVYENGDALYLYYINPETGKNILTSTGVFENGKVAFTMTHCSKYVITSENRGQEYGENNKKMPIWLIASLIVVLVATTTVVCLIRKRKTSGKA